MPIFHHVRESDVTRAIATSFLNQLDQYAESDVIIIGNSGELTTGPHLHFEIWYNGTPLNPEEYITF